MVESKKILVSIPVKLLKEMDIAAKNEMISRSSFIRKSIKLHLKEKRKIEIREKMKTGYLEMSGINSSITEEDLQGEYEDFLSYETKLLGSE